MKQTYVEPRLTMREHCLKGEIGTFLLRQGDIAHRLKEAAEAARSARRADYEAQFRAEYLQEPDTTIEAARKRAQAENVRDDLELAFDGEIDRLLYSTGRRFGFHLAVSYLLTFADQSAAALPRQEREERLMRTLRALTDPTYLENLLLELAEQQEERALLPEFWDTEG